jgi:dihydroorotase
VEGLETAFAAMYTHLVKTGIIPMERLMALLVDNPRKRFHIPLGLDFSIWDLNHKYTVDPDEFQSMGKATPFTGMELFGRCLLTVCDGKIVWQENI